MKVRVSEGLVCVIGLLALAAFHADVLRRFASVDRHPIPVATSLVVLDAFKQTG